MTPVDTLKREAEQKAALEAAAPDLLAALKGVLHYLLIYHDATGRGEDVLSREVHDAVRAAIAKAEGR